MSPGADDTRHPGRQRQGAEVADVIKNYDPADFIGACPYVALHVREEHVDGEAVGDFDGGNHADSEENGYAAPAGQLRQSTAEEPFLFQFPGCRGTSTQI